MEKSESSVGHSAYGTRLKCICIKVENGIRMMTAMMVMMIEMMTMMKAHTRASVLFIYIYICDATHTTQGDGVYMAIP